MIASLLVASWQGQGAREHLHARLPAAFVRVLWGCFLPKCHFQHLEDPACCTRSAAPLHREQRLAAVITENPPEGDRRQEKSLVRTAASRTRCAPSPGGQAGKRAGRLKVQLGQPGRQRLSLSEGRSFVIADLLRLFAGFLLRTDLGYLPLSSSQIAGVSKSALAELTRAGGEEAAHRSPPCRSPDRRSGAPCIRQSFCSGLTWELPSPPECKQQRGQPLPGSQ